MRMVLNIGVLGAYEVSVSCPFFTSGIQTRLKLVATPYDF